MDKYKISSYLILLGVTEFFFLMFISETLYPNYSVKFNYISDLGVGRTAIIFNSSIIVLGILLMVSAVLLRKLFSFAVFLAGLGAMFVGIFPETTGAPHLISALIAFLFGGIGAILSGLTLAHGAVKYFWVILGLMTLSSLVLYVTSYYGPLGPGEWRG